MSTPNPLVAKAPAEPSGFFNAGTGDNGWATGFSIADSAVDAYKGISEGSWIEGGLGVVGLVADAASMAIDPFGTPLAPRLDRARTIFRDLGQHLAPRGVLLRVRHVFHEEARQLGIAGEDLLAHVHACIDRRVPQRRIHRGRLVRAGDQSRQRDAEKRHRGFCLAEHVSGPP